MTEDKRLRNAAISDKDDVIVTELGYLEKASTVKQIQEIRHIMRTKMKISPGYKVLDLGCGIGEEILDIAKQVGSSGLAIGIDANTEAIETANKSLPSDIKNVKYKVQNAENIEFPDNYFDASRSERVFQHLKNLSKSFNEMIRVTKTGGIISVMDPDWDSMMINSDNKEITRMIVHKGADIKVNGWMGRNLLALFQEHGLKDLDLEPYLLMTDDLKLGKLYLEIDRHLNLLVKDKQITEETAKEWMKDLEEKDKKGLFFVAIVTFIVSGKK